MELGFNKRVKMIKRRNPSREYLSSTRMKNEQSKCKVDVPTSRQKMIRN